MATLVLSAAGSAVGGAIGGSILGIAAPTIGRLAGGLVGSAVDRFLFGGSSASTTVEGQRLSSLDVMTATEGAPIARLEGRDRLSGQVIWATRILEEANTTTQSTGGGKGLGGGGGTATVTEYAYFANFAVGICEGAVRHFGRVWADGEALDLDGLTVRFHRGDEAQTPDPLIEAIDGVTPAYKGLAYVVFERLPLAPFGNRIPQFQFECFGETGDLEDIIRGVDIIPGATEWGYMPDVVTAVSRDGAGRIIEERAENNHRHSGRSDWSISMDMLEDVMPNADTGALVVGWFGGDLRAGLCELRPRVEFKDKDTAPVLWEAAGQDRAAAPLVSMVDGRPAYGSTPADVSVVRAIKDLRARGRRTVLYPFIFMDIPADNALPDPSGDASQPAYPWRGRIRPRPGEAVADEVAAFMGTASGSDFSVDGETVTYSGPDEWSFRRLILHLAHLAKAAGGVDAFLIGSEMVAMTTATDTQGVYPFVDALVALAAEVSAILPGAQISYAADWSEYHSHRIGGEVFFHLDPLWSSPDIDFVGIDNYLPLADWRAGYDHADYDPAKGHTSVYSLDYLKSNVEGGEYWDWFYASEADREAQTRTPIFDGAHGEDWVFRQKAIRDWRASAHHNRPGGVREAAPTAWTPSSKPVWFTELGCPAVDLGANQPNVFFSPDSSEGAFPHFSAGVRDDFMQRQFLRAAVEWWRDEAADVVAPEDVFIWTWDARPWPEFPQQVSIWADGPDWRLGHWLNGRAGSAPAAEATERRLALHGFAPADLDLAACHGQVDGYTSTRPTDFRSWLQPLELVLRLDAFEDFGRLTIRARAAAVPIGTISADMMVDAEGAPRFTATLGALEDAAGAAILRFADGTRDYEPSGARAAIEEGPESGQSEAEVPVVIDIDAANGALTAWLRSAAAGRERVAFALPPSLFDVRVGSLLDVTLPNGEAHSFIVEQVTEGEARSVTVSSYDEGATRPAAVGGRTPPAAISPPSRRIALAFLDLPLLLDQSAPDHRGFVAAHAAPWPGGADIYRSGEEETGFALNRQIGLRASVGETLSPLAPGRPGVWSGETVDVKMFSGALVSRPDADVLAGANALAIHHESGEWEVLQFRAAELIGAQTWRLSGLIRGQRGTEAARAAAATPSAAPVVALDAAVAPVAMTPAEIGRRYFWRYGPTGGDPADPVFATEPHTFRGVGRRPFAPAHLRAAAAAGDVTLSWIRRTRIEGDPWTAAEPPIGETELRFLVEIGPEGAPVRAVEVTEASWTYSAGAIAADGVSGAVEARVAQISETFGPGVPARVTLNL